MSGARRILPHQPARPVWSSLLRALPVFLLLVAAPGCLFEPREPEVEAGAPCFVASPAQTPDEVIRNLDGGLECVDPSVYLRQISPEFVFIPAPSVIANYPELFPFEGAWGILREDAFINALSGDVDSRLLWRVIKRSGTSEVLIEAEYRVSVSADGSEIEYTGEAFYTFRQEQTVWVLVRWEEKEAANPLGALKAALVSGR
ncbi:hypothetical protein DRQ53_07155 [bacterium]|nr:MAG: hypothetical protein DRQ53_07155 [bacterium]